jgi:hypothetical protein
MKNLDNFVDERGSSMKWTLLIHAIMLDRISMPLSVEM